MSSTERPEGMSPVGSETSSPGSSPPDDLTPSAVDSPTAPAEGEASEGVAAPASAPPVPQARAKTKGVADIVFVVDISGRMAPCIDALRKNIEAFIDSLSQGGPNNAAPVRDWRGKVVGFRDIEAAQGEGLPWIIDNSFVTDANALKAQLAALDAAGGGDEPESLLDALYKVASMEATPKGAQSSDPGKWRYRSDAARVVIVFTDASFKETMSIPEAQGGSLQDVANVVMANRIILSLFAPNFEGYDRLSQIDKSEWEVVEYEAGQTLWKFKTGSAINSPPITYTHQGRQFVTVLSGVGGSVNRRLKGYDLIPTGGSVTTFALMPD